MSNAFDVIAKAMGEVVHRIDAPLIAGMMMLGMTDPVEHGVAHPNVWRGHVNFGAERPGRVGKLAILHPAEQVETLLNRSIPPGTVFARTIGRAAIEIRIFGR